MEIALSSFTQQYDTTASVDSARQRQQQDAQQQTSAGNNRAREEASQSRRSRTENSQRTPANAENARIINGEVLSSETQRIYSRDASLQDKGAGFTSRSSNNQQPTGQPDARKISVRQAIQTFEENESLIPAGNEQRQISGIIDTFV